MIMKEEDIYTQLDNNFDDFNYNFIINHGQLALVYKYPNIIQNNDVLNTSGNNSFTTGTDVHNNNNNNNSKIIDEYTIIKLSTEGIFIILYIICCDTFFYIYLKNYMLSYIINIYIYNLYIIRYRNPFTK